MSFCDFVWPPLVAAGVDFSVVTVVDFVDVVASVVDFVVVVASAAASEPAGSASSFSVVTVVDFVVVVVSAAAWEPADSSSSFAVVGAAFAV